MKYAYNFTIINTEEYSNNDLKISIPILDRFENNYLSN